MDVISSVQDYITKMISNIPGMKVLVLDKETMGIVSMVYSQSQVLQKEVYLFELLESKARTSMMHLKAVCFLRPTSENKSLLELEFKEPKYGEYHIYFSNSVSEKFVADLANADELECVHQVQEFYADYFAVNKDLFSFNIKRAISPKQIDWNAVQERTVDGLAAVILSLKKQVMIRYSAKSEASKKISTEILRKIQGDQTLFDFSSRSKGTVLLIYDRRDDPVTPLLTQWTYQAMVHELLGINNNRVSLKGNHIPKEMEQIILSGVQDEWFRKSMYLNFGDLGQKVKEELVDDYSAKTANNQKIESMSDIKKFVENYSDYKKLAGHVTRHVTLMSELDKAMTAKQLFEVSEIEQSIACSSDHSTHLQHVKNAISKGATGPPDPNRRQPSIEHLEQLKLALLYALRYEGHANNEVSSIRSLLEQKGHSKESLALLDGIIRYAGKQARSGELFAKTTLINAITNIKKELAGVENIYTQHKPYLKLVLDQIFSNKLKDAEYSWMGPSSSFEPQDVIVFIVGGATFEEAALVHEYNKLNPRVLLGGTKIHNSASFIEDVSEFYKLTR